MKQIQRISMVLLVLALIGMAVNFIIIPLADWIVRTMGILLMAALVVTIYTNVRKNNG